MGYIIAVEPDVRTLNDINEAWGEIAKAMNHKVLTFNNLEAFQKEWQKPEHEAHEIALIMVPAEVLTTDPVPVINNLKTTYKSEIIVSLFDNPKFTKNIELLPVHNCIFKPFDPTILKEHTRFALMKGEKVKTQYVHTTVAKADIEALTKMKILQITEFGFRVSKGTHPLFIGQAYKFYHPLFANGKQQHIWARVVGISEAGYEMVFCQINSGVLSQIRKKIISSAARVRGAAWQGRISSSKTRLRIVLSSKDETLNTTLQDLIDRNFEYCDFIFNDEVKPNAKINADLVISDQEYERKEIDSIFHPEITYFRFFVKPEKRVDLEARFTLETVRLEMPYDKAIIVKLIKQLFPFMKEKDPTPINTINMEEQVLLSTLIEVSEYSEAAMAFKQMTLLPLGKTLDIALSQEDENIMKEMKARVNFVEDRPDADKLYYHQLILFGMKDEFLKLIRLWTLQRHIEKNNKTG